MIPDLFQTVVEALGLSMIIGPGVVRRALVDAGFDPKSATARDYQQALGRMEARLASYMTASEAAMRISKIRVLLGSCR